MTANARSREKLAGQLAAVSAVAGGFGALFAIASPAWWPVPIDGTRAMIVGISILLAAGLPLIAAAAILVASRFPSAATIVRRPAAALAIAFTLMGFWYTSAPDPDALWWVVSLASLCVGVAVGGMALLLPLARPVAIVVGLAVALALAAAQVAFMLPMLAFAVPVLAIGIVVLLARASRQRAFEPSRSAAE